MHHRDRNIAEWLRERPSSRRSFFVPNNCLIISPSTYPSFSWSNHKPDLFSSPQKYNLYEKSITQAVKLIRKDKNAYISPQN